MASNSTSLSFASMEVNDDGELESLPLILKDYAPNLDRLPQLLMRLGPQVNGSIANMTMLLTYGSL